jgi:hypothetical protein
MKKINEGIVYSNDINLILKGYNNLDFKYKGIIMPDAAFIEELRKDFKRRTSKMFDKITTISEEDMISSIYNSIKDVLGIYPHRLTR